MNQMFSLREIAKAADVPIESAGGISYAASWIQIQLANGKWLYLREGDDEINDHIVELHASKNNMNSPAYHPCKINCSGGCPACSPEDHNERCQWAYNNDKTDACTCDYLPCIHMAAGEFLDEILHIWSKIHPPIVNDGYEYVDKTKKHSHGWWADPKDIKTFNKKVSAIRAIDI